MTVERDDSNSRFTESSGNVFADLGLPATEKDMLKVQIALAISATIEKRKLTQVQAAKIIGTDQAKISAVLRGRLRDLSVERLIHFLILLGRDIEVKFGQYRQNAKGQIRVRNAA